MTSNGDSFNSLDPSTAYSRHGTRSASGTPSSTIRPRNRRLISFAEEENEDGGDATSTGSLERLPSSSMMTTGRLRSETPSSSRDASPIPKKHPSRATSLSPYRDSSASRSTSQRGWDNQNRKQATGLGTDFWGSSWSSLQELASSVMGSDTSGGKNIGMPWLNGQPGQHKRKPSKPGSFRIDTKSGSSKFSLPTSWGPSGLLGKQSLAGSKEERDALVQAKRREALLEANGDMMADRRGNYKRRDSSDLASPGPNSGDQVSDTLVYVHQVQPDDSLTSVSIRYGCQLAVLRKANGFWPSDTVQSRKTVVLPVNACTIKGIPIRANQTDHHDVGDLLEDDTMAEDPALSPPKFPSGTIESGGSDSRLNYGSPVSSVSGKKPSKTPAWTHENWVQIEGFAEPVELGRVPQGTLGYFPRARRKSITQLKPYSDYDDDISRSSSFSQLPETRTPPPAEYNRDFPVSNPSRSPAPSPLRDRSTSNSNSSAKPRSRHHRNRSSIVLHGPGGVGTLDRRSLEPGPGHDKLNDFVTSHIPNLAVPSHVSAQPIDPTSDNPVGGPTRGSFDSTSSNASSLGLENVGGAIEGWFRKVATRAQSSLNELQQPSQPNNRLGIRGNGDLIELDNTRESSRTVTPRHSTPPKSPSRDDCSRAVDQTSSSVTGASGHSIRGRRVTPSEPGRVKGD